MRKSIGEVRVSGVSDYPARCGWALAMSQLWATSAEWRRSCFHLLWGLWRWWSDSRRTCR